MKARLCIFVAVAISITSAARGATPAEVEKSIRRAIDYLYETQREGIWEFSSNRTELDGKQAGGTTALCVYALLAAGEHHENERLKPAIQYLMKTNLNGVYAVAMRTQVWNQLPRSQEVDQAMVRDARFLAQAILKNGAARGFYDSLEDGPGSGVDNSISQFGLLGLWSCLERVEVLSNEQWRLIDESWRKTQHPAGSWSYMQNPTARYPATVAMTSVGVATLFTTQDFINRGRSLDATGNIRDPNVDKGLKWISDNYKTLFNDSIAGRYQPYYSLYGVELIGLASGYRHFGEVDWYQDGADFLIKNQNRIGGWEGTVNTAMSLLFLTFGRAPLMMNKLDYDVIRSPGNTTVDANWNQRPRDAANLAKFTGRQSERRLNWQIVDINKASVEDLLEAPILYISGNQALTFSTAQKQKLKQFIEQGGLLVAHADGASQAFATSIRRLGTELFQYEFRALPANHIIFTGEQFQSSNWRRKPSVHGLSNGVRELILLLPDGDPSRYWQSYDIGGRNEVFELAANIFQYSVDKQNLRYRGETFLVSSDPALQPERTIKLARVQYPGNWNPEPAGWTRLAAILNNQHRTALNVLPVDIKQLGSSDAKVAHLTGTTAARFDEASRNAIKAFVGNGGVLIVDAAGGSTAFASSIEQEFAAIFGAEADLLKEPLSAEHAIYRTPATVDIAYRPHAQRSLTGNLRVGRLRGMMLAGRLALIYSPEDLSAGLVGQPVDGILGYTPSTSERIMINLLLQLPG